MTLRPSQLAGDTPREDGMAVRIETGAGPAAACRVYHVERDRVALDFNHPFAGEAVTRSLWALRVAPPAARGVPPPR